jgi:hypothetical protein
MTTRQRKFEGTTPALHAHGAAMEFAIAGLRRCVISPVDAGVAKTL